MPQITKNNILTIDLGTTYFKIARFDRDGQLCDVCRIAPSIIASEAGRMELPVHAFVETIAQGISELRRRDNRQLADIEAISFATQTNSFVLLDADNQSLTPLVLWPDERARPLDAAIRNRCDIPGFSATTGVPRVNHQFMPAKLLWFQNHLPAIWKQVGRVCLMSDYLTLLFTGKHVTEAGAAGLTGLVDIHRCQWWPEMLTRFGIEERCLPSIRRAGTDLGSIDPQASQRFGLPASCRFVLGCLDQYAGAIGAGCVAPNMISETTGTVLATVRCVDRFASQPNPAVFQGPAFQDGRYWQMAFGEISANYLEWYRKQLPDQPSYEQLTDLAESIEPGAEGLKLRSHVGLTKPKEVFEGLTARHTCGHMVRCIMEAVAHALGDQIACLCANSEGHAMSTMSCPDVFLPQEIRCAGGAARSDFWLQIKADMLGIDAVATQCPEPTSLGAAILAEASLEDADIGEVAQRWVQLKPSHHPDPQQHRQYSAAPTILR
jgi:sugar (pentulose or hexulose) kinase